VGEESGFAESDPEIQDILRAMNWEDRLEEARVLRKEALAKRKLEQDVPGSSGDRPVYADLRQITDPEYALDSDVEAVEEHPESSFALSGLERLEEALALHRGVHTEQMLEEGALESVDEHHQSSNSRQSLERNSLNYSQGGVLERDTKDQPKLVLPPVETPSFSQSGGLKTNELAANNNLFNGVAFRLALGLGFGLGIGLSVVLGLSILEIQPKLRATEDLVLPVEELQATTAASVQVSNVPIIPPLGLSEAPYSIEELTSIALGSKMSTSNPSLLSNIVFLSTQVGATRLSRSAWNAAMEAPILQSPTVRDVEPVVQRLPTRIYYQLQIPQAASPVPDEDRGSVARSKSDAAPKVKWIASIPKPSVDLDVEPLVPDMSLRPDYSKMSPELALVISGDENSALRPLEPIASTNTIRASPILIAAISFETENKIAWLDIKVPATAIEAGPVKEVTTAANKPDSLRVTNALILGADAYEAVLNAPSTLTEEEISIVAASVRETGMSLDGVNRVNFKISTKQVRFFYSDDAKLASAVAQHIGAQARDFTDYRPSPPVGSIEIYLAGKGNSVARKAPRRRKSISEAERLRSKIVRRLRNGEHLR
jgi:hypothetical protein